MSRDFWLVVGGIAAGAIGATLLAKNKEKIKPAAASMLAKAMAFKEKAMNCAASAKEQAEEVVAEAKQINDAKPAQQA